MPGIGGVGGGREHGNTEEQVFWRVMGQHTLEVVKIFTFKEMLKEVGEELCKTLLQPCL